MLCQPILGSSQWFWGRCACRGVDRPLSRAGPPNPASRAGVVVDQLFMTSSCSICTSAVRLLGGQHRPSLRVTAAGFASLAPFPGMCTSWITHMRCHSSPVPPPVTTRSTPKRLPGSEGLGRRREEGRQGGQEKRRRLPCPGCDARASRRTQGTASALPCHAPSRDPSPTLHTVGK